MVIAITAMVVLVHPIKRAALIHGPPVIPITVVIALVGLSQ
jgi:hypothetical protein